MNREEDGLSRLAAAYGVSRDIFAVASAIIDNVPSCDGLVKPDAVTQVVGILVQDANIESLLKEGRISDMYYETMKAMVGMYPNPVSPETLISAVLQDIRSRLLR